MASATVEDYVKAIYTLQRESPTGEAAGARIAALLGVTKGSVTSMVGKLRRSELADAEPYGGVRLTDRGRALALDVLRRHRLIEVFLVEVLGFDWSDVHDEAERLEHAMSARLLDRLDAYLGHPAIDPHGDPIPDAEGRIVEPEGTPLPELNAGTPGAIVRITDQEPEFLGFVSRHGLRPGARFEVLEIVPEAESITLRAEGYDAVPLSWTAASKLLATHLSSEDTENGPRIASHGPRRSASDPRDRLESTTIDSEDTLRAILELSGRDGGCRLDLLTGRFGERASFLDPTIEGLAAGGWLVHRPDRTVELTDEGRRRAVEIRSRHVEIVQALTALGVPRHIAETDADGIEHCASPETLRGLRRGPEARRA